MKYSVCGENKDIAYVESDKQLITDTQSALDLMATVQYQTDCKKIIIKKNLLCDDFFILSRGIAGEVLQKFINYHTKLAIVGDYSNYTSKPLQDFIRESNRGNDFFFVATVEEAIERLSKAR